MSAHQFCLFLFGAATLSSTALAQGPGVEVQAGLGYARVFARCWPFRSRS